jgi:hypothetical protein
MGGRILMPKVYVEVNEKNEVIGWATSRGSETEIEIEIDEAHPFFNESPFFFKVKDGKTLEKDETLQQTIRKDRSNRLEIRELKEFLKESDFYFIRKMDEGTEIPVDIRQKRLAARKRLKDLGL